MVEHPLNVAQFARHVGVVQSNADTWVSKGYLKATPLNPYSNKSERLITVDEVERVAALVQFARVIGIPPSTMLAIAHGLRTHTVPEEVATAIVEAIAYEVDKDDGNNGHKTDHPQVA